MHLYQISGLESARVVIGRSECVVCKTTTNVGSYKLQVLMATLSCKYLLLQFMHYWLVCKLPSPVCQLHPIMWETHVRVLPLTNPNILHNFKVLAVHHMKLELCILTHCFRNSDVNRQ